MRIIQTVPVLRMFDVAKAREFYLEYLGFRSNGSTACRYQRPGVALAPWLRFNEDLQ